jgi:hypothetical protein
MSLEDKQAEYLHETTEEVIRRLSKLSTMEYELQRVKAAKKLNFRPSALDKMVAEEQANEIATTDEIVKVDEPHHSTVDGNELLDEMSETISRYMILPKGALTPIVLWIVSTYVYDAFNVYPKLGVISPEKRCGKSTLLDILGAFSCKSILSSNITPSSIFRVVEKTKPTLLIDEADTFIAGRNDDLIGIINSGHTKRTASVIRTVGEDYTPKKFSTWAPMAFASIKGLPGTIMDRSIVIQLRRRTIAETVARTPVDFWEDSELIRQKMVRWGVDNINDLKANHIEPPIIQNDRAITNWLPLFTIAHAVGGEWSEKVNASYLLINNQEDEESAPVMLLHDIQFIFNNRDCDRIHSIDLVRYLVDMEERPWCEWKRGNPMTANSLAKQLSTFGIRSKTIRGGVPSKTLKGYELKQFTDSFSRYIPSPPDAPI